MVDPVVTELYEDLCFDFSEDVHALRAVGHSSLLRHGNSVLCLLWMCAEKNRNKQVVQKLNSSLLNPRSIPKLQYPVALHQGMNAVASN